MDTEDRRRRKYDNGDENLLNPDEERQKRNYSEAARDSSWIAVIFAYFNMISPLENCWWKEKKSHATNWVIRFFEAREELMEMYFELNFLPAWMNTW